MPEIKLPLIFGNKEQIDTIKENEKILEFNKLPPCNKCHGDGECSRCGHECIYCDGVGKEYDGLCEFKMKYPNWRLK